MPLLNRVSGEKTARDQKEIDFPLTRDWSSSDSSLLGSVRIFRFI